MRRLATTLLFLLIPYFAQCQIDFDKMRKQYERRFAFLDSMSGKPTDFDLQFEEITVVISDSISISAWFIPKAGSKYTLLMVHGFMMNKSHMLSRAKFFSELGLSVLLMDLRARGSSTGRKTGGMGEGNVPDVSAIANYYSKNMRSYGKLIGYGFSHGGRALIHSVRIIPEMKILILESTPYSLADGLQRQMRLPTRPEFQEEDLDGALSRIPALPILLMIGDTDLAITPNEGEKLLKHTVNKKSKMIIFKGTQHDVVINENGDLVRKAVIDFLRLKNDRR